MMLVEFVKVNFLLLLSAMRYLEIRSPPGRFGESDLKPQIKNGD